MEYSKYVKYIKLVKHSIVPLHKPTLNSATSWCLKQKRRTNSVFSVYSPFGHLQLGFDLLFAACMDSPAEGKNQTHEKPCWQSSTHFFVRDTQIGPRE